MFSVKGEKYKSNTTKMTNPHKQEMEESRVKILKAKLAREDQETSALQFITKHITKAFEEKFLLKQDKGVANDS